ncbi:MAG: HAD-IB family phosphatase, partial [Candidatus Geothermarchaeales archaeon]
MGRVPGLKLVVFDLDGTLVEEPSSWSKIHRHFGTETVERRNLRAYSGGDMTYDEFAVRDIEAWPRTTHLDDIWRILQHYRYLPGARTCLKNLSKMGLLTAIVSAGLDLLAYAVADDLAIDYVLANGLEVDEEVRIDIIKDNSL